MPDAANGAALESRVLLTAILVGPMLLFDLSGYSTAPGPNQDSLAGVSLFLYVPVGLFALGAAWALARTRFAWAAGAFAMIATLPRMLSYQTSFMLVGLPWTNRGRAEEG